MKKVCLLITLLFVSTLNAQLNSNATLIKEKLPEQYELIKTLASEDWEGDHEMMIYTINNQSDSFKKVLGFEKEPNYDETILKKALSKWSKVIKGYDCTDWCMVEYTYKNQIKAKSE